jgi:hydroxyacylglutathione hydrolase
MASSTEIAKRYFAALNDHDLDAAVAVWAPGAPDRLVGQAELTAPWGILEYFGELFAAFPDFSLTILETTAGQGRAVVRWRGTGTFAGPGRFQGFDPNGARIEVEGCDVVTVAGDLIVANTAYIDGADLARQLGFLPPAGSGTEQRLTALANLRTRLRAARFGVEPEQIAPGVWVVRGGRPRRMNVYLIEDEGGVTVFDAGVSEMAESLRAACVRMGGIRRVVLGHADCDHRGSAPGLGAPVYCHEAERQAASSADSYRPYWDFSKLAPYARPLYRRLLRDWDGGAVEIAGTVAEGDEIAGFRVVELPGHAPGLIGLLRESDRLALVSDCFYTINPQTGIKNAAHVPHPAFNQDTEMARESIRKLAALRPSAAWPGHADPVTGEITAQLEHAASAPA